MPPRGRAVSSDYSGAQHVRPPRVQALARLFSRWRGLLLQKDTARIYLLFCSKSI